MESRQNAFERYEILLAMVERQGHFFLPFARQEDFVQGENASYSAKLFLVEDIEGEEELYIIQGEDEKTTIDALKSEKEIFESLKISQS
jgi:hypothetical protein